MSTRGIVGFVVGGQEKLTYNQCDSYPGGLGSDTVAWLRRNLVEDRSGSTVLDPEMLGVVMGLQVVPQDAEPSAAQIARLGGRFYEKVSTGKDWYAHLRKCQGDLDLMVTSGYLLEGGSEFAHDAVFCEWGYVIDVDAGVLEVYSSPGTGGRWADDPEAIQQVCSIPFAEVRGMSLNDFLARCGE